jgi:hypothetical protein
LFFMTQGILKTFRKGPIMTTIIVLNAISSLLAAVGIGGILIIREKRRTRQKIVEVLYVTAAPPRPRR